MTCILEIGLTSGKIITIDYDKAEERDASYEKIAKALWQGERTVKPNDAEMVINTNTITYIAKKGEIPAPTTRYR